MISFPSLLQDEFASKTSVANDCVDTGIKSGEAETKL